MRTPVGANATNPWSVTTVTVNTAAPSANANSAFTVAFLGAANTSVYNFVILNLGCTVGHDTIIGDYCSFMPSVNISGEVIIENSVYVGTGAKIINLLTIGNSTIVGAGAVVSKSLPEKCTAVGIPAKPIKFHKFK